jgi:hypothetical protein
LGRRGRAHLEAHFNRPQLGAALQSLLERSLDI